MDYIHWNPVKHGLAQRADNWPYSTFRRCVAAGICPADWDGTGGVPVDGGERLQRDCIWIGRQTTPFVMAGLDPAIHAVPPPMAWPITRKPGNQTGETGARKTARMAGSSPAH